MFTITFTSNKVFYFSEVNVFIAYHPSESYLQSERKARLYLAQKFRFFISNTLDFLILLKKEELLENTCS